MHLKRLLFITGWMGELQQPSRLNMSEPTFSPLLPQSCREAGAAAVQDVLRVSCDAGGVEVMVSCGCECFRGSS